jgi:hypothetical protein
MHAIMQPQSSRKSSAAPTAIAAAGDFGASPTAKLKGNCSKRNLW